MVLTLSKLCLLGHSKVHPCSDLQIQPSPQLVMKLADFVVAKGTVAFLTSCLAFTWQ